MRNVLTNCEYLETFYFANIHTSTPIMEFVAQNYPQKCLAAFIRTAVCQNLPLIFSRTRPLSKLNAFRHTSQIEYLIVVSKFNKPNEGGWDDYQNILALCPNLKGICLVECIGGQRHTLVDSTHITPDNQRIWDERIAYFNSRDIEVLTWVEYLQRVKTCSKDTKFYFVKSTY
jgi:hypothetical protein